MPTIKASERLLKRTAVINFLANEPGLNITPMLVGPHGIGKSAICRAAAKDMGGYSFTVECGSLKEGELTGLPFASPNADGTSEVRFVKYFHINKIFQLEKMYYEKAKTTGFLGGSVRLEIADNGDESVIVENGKEKIVVSTKDAIDKVEAGEDNRFKFGEALDGKTKMALIESGEIRPVILFFDELNRTDTMTMKELMNIILNKSVNGYDFPWWVSICAAINPCSQNSTYATNEMDDAQNDRFLRLKVDAALEEWIDYALAKHVNTDIVEGLAISEAIFQHKEKGYEDTTEMYPTPRSWEMCALIYDLINETNNTKFFSTEDKKFVDDDLRVLLRGKVGDNAARTMLENIARRENNIKPAEIITMKKKNIEPAIVQKFNAQKRLTQKIIADNVLNYLLNTIDDVKKNEKSTDAKKKEIYTNYMSQVKEFMNLLDTATQIVICKKMATSPYRERLFTKIAAVFSEEVLRNIYDAKGSISDLAQDKH